jgi:hypothetical protein
MRELVIYWKKGSINVLRYMYDFFFSKKGKQACLLLCRRVQKDFFDAGLIINESKCGLDPALCLRQLGFDVDMGEGEFRVPVGRWEALQSKTDAILTARGGRVPMELAREYFSESSTYRELLGVYRCLQSMVHRCEETIVVLHVDAQNLLGIVNRGSPKLIINELARGIFWFCLRQRITASVE